MAKKKVFQEEPYDIFARAPTPVQSEDRASQTVLLLHPAASEQPSYTPPPSPQSTINLQSSSSVKASPTGPKDDALTMRIIDEPRVRHTLELESAEQEREYQAFEARLRQRFGSGVTFSVLGRALFTALLRAEGQVFKAGDKVTVPAVSDRKNPEKAAEYQELWNRIITNALAAAAPIPKDMRSN
jgi:hypothetical protein